MRYRTEGLCGAFAAARKEFYRGIKSAFRKGHFELTEEARLCEVLIEMRIGQMDASENPIPVGDMRAFHYMYEQIAQQADISSMEELESQAREEKHQCILRLIRYDDETSQATSLSEIEVKYPGIHAPYAEIMKSVGTLPAPQQHFAPAV